MTKLIRNITFIALMSWSCVAWAQPDEFGFIPNNASGTFYGQVTINGTPASGDDWVAAFDETGVCAGASQIVINNGIAYANLVIYGDDGTSTNIDEGIGSGESFQLMLWRSSYDDITPYPNPDDPVDFTEWANTNGAPMPAYSDVAVVYDFSAESTASIVDPGVLCVNSNPILLEGIPAGGVFYGDGVENDIFDPLVSGLGQHLVIYEVGGVVTSISITVIDAIDAEILTTGPFCNNEGEVHLEANDDSGVWLGTAVFDNILDIDLLGPGTYMLEYIIENGSCSSEDQIFYSVYPSPDSPTLEYDGTTITATYEDGLTANWYDNSGGLLLENSSTYNPTVTGTYNCEVVNGQDCSASESISITEVGVNEMAEDVTWVWVNSNTIEFTSELNLSISLYNIQGSLIESYNNINGAVSFPTISSGMYVLVASSDNCKLTIPFIK